MRQMKNKWKLVGDIAIMYIKRKNGDKHEVIMDDFDLYRLFHLGVTWHVHGKGPLPYVGSSISGRKVQLHRYILSAPEGMLVDHINGDPLDNRKQNLRLVDHSGNAQNRHRLGSNNQSGYRGVWRDSKTGLWNVSVGVDNKQMFFGAYEDVQTANYVAKITRKNLLPFSQEAMTSDDELKESSVLQ